MTGRSGEVAREPPAVLRHPVRRGDPLAGHELEHLVEQEKGRAMGEDRFDLLTPEGRSGVHGAESTGEARRSRRSAPQDGLVAGGVARDHDERPEPLDPGDSMRSRGRRADRAASTVGPHGEGRCL